MAAWRAPTVGELVTCETVAAIVVHARRIVESEVRLSGHTAPRPLALCGSPVDWDTMIPVAGTSCRWCKALLPSEVR